jgi:hypothetical protein
MVRLDVSMHEPSSMQVLQDEAATREELKKDALWHHSCRSSNWNPRGVFDD